MYWRCSYLLLCDIMIAFFFPKLLTDNITFVCLFWLALSCSAADWGGGTSFPQTPSVRGAPNSAELFQIRSYSSMAIFLLAISQLLYFLACTWVHLPPISTHGSYRCYTYSVHAIPSKFHFTLHAMVVLIVKSWIVHLTLTPVYPNVARLPHCV